MNREILFRGKRLDNGEWVEGFYTSNPPWDRRLYGERHWIVSCKNGMRYEVDPATVGQYTSLTDKNGKRIFEGDILGSRYDEKFPDDVTIERVLWFRNAWHIQQGKHDPELLEDEEILLYSEVIGNVHDNPEFTKNTTPEPGWCETTFTVSSTETRSSQC